MAFILALSMLGFYPVWIYGEEIFTIDTEKQWEEWKFPRGVVTLTPDGRVQVGSVRKGINASLDARQFTYERDGTQFTGGIRSVGSNTQDADKILDGDLKTFWAPEPDVDVKQWRIEVDLGRAVTVTTLRLVFAEGRNPFGNFKIFVSDGILKFPGTASKDMDYELVFQTQKPNEDRILEIVFSEHDEAGRPLSGKVFQYIRVVPLDKVEDPGLAELEVHTLGDNIAIGTLERGGSIVAGAEVPPPTNLFDGKFWTDWVIPLLGDNWAGGDTQT
ncbi:MAG: discoidin domain-containing protein, partial [Candidatus Latescibacteria bacterium]|nr:discoidin domain-containing protein [Candidatus Latescibacterota bacterium]